MTKAEIITDTVRYYEEDRSRVARTLRHACMYLTPEGRKCAVGRYMLEGPHQYFDGSCSALSDQYLLDEVLEEPVRGHELAFWDDLQFYHDGLRRAAQRREYIARMWLCWCPDEPMPDFTFAEDVA